VIRDPIRAGIAAGWKATDASTLERDLALEADVAIVGTGAGGGVTAEILAQAGLDVVLVEEGPLKSSSDFRMVEAEAYPQLYQESAARKTLDKAITILQGRSVGGSTTVNWTSSFRTPPATLAHWRERWGLREFTPEALAPWFERMERRLAVATWTVAPNENNALLRRGADRLGIATAAIRRNVKDCWNLGYCGMGCPTNAKQSMLVTCIPAALARGARLVYRARAGRLALRGGRADALVCQALDARGVQTTVYSDHFLEGAAADGPIGFKLEAAPLHPLLLGMTLQGFGPQHAALMEAFPHAHALIALLRDGFHPDSPGGNVGLRDDGSPVLAYPLTPYLWAGVRRAYRAMAEIQFAAGARAVLPLHERAAPYPSWPAAQAAIDALPLAPLLARVMSAHVMGGCAMADRPERGVVDPLGRHFQLDNVSVHDGSVFPTSLGANPQLSIYALAARSAVALAAALAGKPAVGGT